MKQPAPNIPAAVYKPLTLVERLKNERAVLEHEWLKGNQQLIDLDLRIAQAERAEKLFPWFKEWVDWFKGR